MNAQHAKQFGLRFNQIFEKYMSLFVPASLVLGFFLYPWLYGLTSIIPLLFAYLTFVMALGCGWDQMKQAWRMPVPMLMTFIMVHITAPLFAYGAGIALFGSGSPYVVGMVLFTIIPLGVSSVIWVSMSRGHVPLVLSMIVIDSALSPLVVPLAISLFFGTQLEFDHMKVMKDLLMIIVVPTLLGVAVNELSRGKAKPWSAPVTGPTSKLAFMAVVMINAAAITPHVMQLREDLPVLIPAVIGLVAFCYALGYLGSWLLKDQQLTITLTYSSGMRNISLGVVIGLAYFEPLAAVPVVLSILVQQPMATLNHWVLAKIRARREKLAELKAQRVSVKSFTKS